MKKLNAHCLPPEIVDIYEDVSLFLSFWPGCAELAATPSGIETRTWYVFSPLVRLLSSSAFDSGACVELCTSEVAVEDDPYSISE